MAVRAVGKFWVLLLCISALLRDVAICDEQYELCNLPCCTVEPNCNSAEYIDCFCDDQNLVSLRQGAVPKSTQTLHIHTKSDFTIHRQAIYHLTSLTELKLYGMQTLQVQAEGLMLASNQSTFTFGLDNVRYVELLGYAFSGHWGDQTAINIEGTQTTVIRSGAFKFMSTNTGPIVRLNHISQLELSTDAIVGDIGRLQIAYSNMQRCTKGGFGKNIRQIEMRNVSIDDAQEGCIMSSGDLMMLSILSSNISTIQTGALSGKIAEVRLHKVNVKSVEKNGLQLNVDRFELTAARFDKLKPNAFSVAAKQHIWFKDINVNTLQQNALSGLIIQQKNPYAKYLIIRNLYITDAKEGSLAFAVRLTLYNLTVVSPHFCPTENLTRLLVGTIEKAKGDEEEDFTQAQEQVLIQMRSRSDCKDIRYPQGVTSGSSIAVADAVGNHVDNNAARITGEDAKLSEEREMDDVVEHPASGDSQNDSKDTNDVGNTLPPSVIVLITLIVAICALVFAICVWFYIANRCSSSPTQTQKLTDQLLPARPQTPERQETQYEMPNQETLHETPHQETHQQTMVDIPQGNSTSYGGLYPDAVTESLRERKTGK